jgi:hypothetical protein
VDIPSSDPKPRKPVLKLDWCSHAAAKYAVEHWHYSRSLSASKSARVGVWEDGAFIGVVIFAWGNNRNMPKMFRVEQTECAELVRVALAKHATPVSRIIAIAAKMLRAEFPTMRVLVSYADPNQGHHGGVYQGAGWLYIGRSQANEAYEINGRVAHKRLLTGRSYGRAAPPMPEGARRVVPITKHRYALPLDAAMRAQILPLAKPYPKRAGPGSCTGTTSAEGGSTPTPALQF